MNTEQEKRRCLASIIGTDTVEDLDDGQVDRAIMLNGNYWAGWLAAKENTFTAMSTTGLDSIERRAFNSFENARNGELSTLGFLRGVRAVLIDLEARAIGQDVDLGEFVASGVLTVAGLVKLANTLLTEERERADAMEQQLRNLVSLELAKRSVQSPNPQRSEEWETHRRLWKPSVDGAKAILDKYKKD